MKKYFIGLVAIALATTAATLPLDNKKLTECTNNAYFFFKVEDDVDVACDAAVGDLDHSALPVVTGADPISDMTAINPTTTTPPFGCVIDFDEACAIGYLSTDPDDYEIIDIDLGPGTDNRWIPKSTLIVDCCLERHEDL